MILGADVVRYLLSAGGVFLLFLLASLWMFFSFRPRRRAARIFLIVAVLFTVGSSYGLQILVARLLVGSFEPFERSRAAPGRRTAVVILGSGSYRVEDWDGSALALPDLAAAARVLEATRVFKLIDPALIISSGGDPHPKAGRPPSGDTMGKLLMELGIPADRILVETRSLTTRDEAVIVGEMLRAHAFDQVVLVTSETHMRRSVAAFRSVGIDAIPAIAQDYTRSE